MLLMVVFYSGFNASTVEIKKGIIIAHLGDLIQTARYTDIDVNQIMNDVKMIRNETKIQSCIKNAKEFESIVRKTWKFQQLPGNLPCKFIIRKPLLLKEELEYRVDYLGGTTVYHFLTDLGFDVLKPDRVILRLFKRIGMIESHRQLLKAIVHGQNFAKATNLPIRYIDTMLVKYGQKGKSRMFGLENGICLEKQPFCTKCTLFDDCLYYQGKLTTNSKQ
jgi:DNA-3-methyladenine glycosylase I